MFGLDDQIAALSDGAGLLVVCFVAILLGLRHATDPDHLAAVTTLIASGRERSARVAAALSAYWGAGHALSLFLFGLPILLYEAYLPAPLQRAAETAIGFVIAALAVWLIVRWRRGAFHVHVHEREDGPALSPRSPLQAFAIGLVHGMGGSAGVGVLLLTTIEDRGIAIVALGLLAAFTAVSMAIVSSGFGLTLSSELARRSFGTLAPALGVASLAFGLWYALGANEIVPYYF